MSNRNHASVLAMLASISILSFTACSDDAVNNPVPVATGSLATESSSSEAVSNPGSSNNEALSSSLLSSSSAISSASKIVELARLSTCDAHNEGAVDTMWVGNIKYGSLGYYRCEKGEWVQKTPAVTCDTTGANVGDVCTRIQKVGFFGGHESRIVYIYKGNDEKIQDHLCHYFIMLNLVLKDA